MFVSRTEVRRSLFLEGSHTLLRTRMEKQSTKLAAKRRTKRSPTNEFTPVCALSHKSRKHKHVEAMHRKAITAL